MAAAQEGQGEVRAERNDMKQAVWDGKDLAAIQMLGTEAERRHGMPAVRVDADWNLSIATEAGVLVSVPIGHEVAVGERGHLTTSAPGEALR
jgi:hypothetical protein